MFDIGGLIAAPLISGLLGKVFGGDQPTAPAAVNPDNYETALQKALRPKLTEMILGNLETAANAKKSMLNKNMKAWGKPMPTTTSTSIPEASSIAKSTTGSTSTGTTPNTWEGKVFEDSTGRKFIDGTATTEERREFFKKYYPGQKVIL